MSQMNECAYECMNEGLSSRPKRWVSHELFYELNQNSARKTTKTQITRIKTNLAASIGVCVCDAAHTRCAHCPSPVLFRGAARVLDHAPGEVIIVAHYPRASSLWDSAFVAELRRRPGGLAATLFCWDRPISRC